MDKSTLARQLEMYLFSTLLLATLPLGAAQAASWDFDKGSWVDLSHAYDDSTIYWPTASGFKKTTDFEGHTEGGWYYTAYSIATAEHGGTHLDAPIHFHEGGLANDQLPLERLLAPAVVIDVTKQSAADADYLISVADVEAWEAAHGKVPDGAIVLFRTGFAARWPDAASYLGTAERGAGAVAKLHFPGLSPELAKFLSEQRKIAAVGLDTASIDRGQSRDFMAHQVMFAHSIPAFENVGDMSSLPATGSFVVALPMKIGGGSGGPLRIVAFVPD
jgi:kynurenine formamidase